jgi:hypothetical protein
MIGDAWPKGLQIKIHTFPFKLYPKNWEDFKIDKEFINALHWNEVKFLNDQGNDFSNEIKNLPNNRGGIYIFIIKSEVLPSISEYLAYIGRALYTDTHSLRVRCRRYLTEYLNEKERPKITTLMKLFGNRLYLKYTIIEKNELIVELEAELINSLLPPFNDQVPDIITRQAVNAFK